MCAFPNPLPGELRARMRKFIIVMLTLVVSGTFSPVDHYSPRMLVAAGGMVLLGVLLKILYFDLGAWPVLDAARCGYARVCVCVCVRVAASVIPTE